MHWQVINAPRVTALAHGQKGGNYGLKRNARMELPVVPSGLAKGFLNDTVLFSDKRFARLWSV